MKTKFSKKIIALAVLAITTPVGIALAQGTIPVSTPLAPVQVAGQPAMPMAQPGGAPVSVTPVGQVPPPPQGAMVGAATDSGPSNLESNRTVLVREYEKKRLQLDIRKLEKEIEKLDEHVKTETPSNSPAAGNPQPYNPFNLPPEIQAQITAGKKAMDAPAVALTPETKVYSIYGFENSLLAKLAVGTQGGYVVTKGDVLPDGRMVSDIKPNYVLISSGSGKKEKKERIFLSEPPAVAATGAGAVPNNGNSGSANINPITGLGSMPGGGVFTPSTTRLPTMNILNISPPTTAPGAPAGK